MIAAGPPQHAQRAKRPSPWLGINRSWSPPCGTRSPLRPALKLGRLRFSMIPSREVGWLARW
eukprot:7091073-Alexandrium_andersonii.AAC.1